MNNQEKTFTYHDEEKLGKLYILGKVENAEQDEKSYIINLTASALRREYYDYPNRKPKKALQASLNKANKILNKFKNKKLHFVCAVLCDDGLFISQTKNNKFSKINQTQSEEIKDELIKKAPKTPLSLFKKAKKFQISGLVKAMAGFYLVFILILTGTIYFTQQNTKQQETFEFENTLSQVKQKILQADAVLIYKEFERAKAFLQEAQNLIIRLPSSQEKNNLEQEIKNKLNKTNNIKIIQDIKIINLPENLSGLIKIQNYLFSFNPENNRIYKTDQEPKRVSRNSINIGYFKKSCLFEAEDSILFLTDTPDIALYSVHKNSAEKAKITLPKQEIKDISNYYYNIYLLTQDQIYKYSRTLAGFQGPYSWFKQKQEFINPKSFAIDGDIYVLDNNQVLKFVRGEQQEFDLDKNLENPIKIFTLPKLENIYVLEKNKILVFDKSGALITQYTNSSFSNLTDIWVEKDKTIYLLNNNQEILEFEIK